jgi:hypothetical protein
MWCTSLRPRRRDPRTRSWTRTPPPLSDRFDGALHSGRSSGRHVLSRSQEASHRAGRGPVGEDLGAVEGGEDEDPLRVRRGPGSPLDGRLPAGMRPRQTWYVAQRIRLQRQTIARACLDFATGVLCTGGLRGGGGWPGGSPVTDSGVYFGVRRRTAVRAHLVQRARWLFPWLATDLPAVRAFFTERAAPPSALRLADRGSEAASSRRRERSMYRHKDPRSDRQGHRSRAPRDKTNVSCGSPGRGTSGRPLTQGPHRVPRPPAQEGS